MLKEDDRDYFRKRAEQELEAVVGACDPAAASVHRALAARYSLLAEEAVASQAPELSETATPR